MSRMLRRMQIRSWKRAGAVEKIHDGYFRNADGTKEPRYRWPLPHHGLRK